LTKEVLVAVKKGAPVDKKKVKELFKHSVFRKRRSLQEAAPTVALTLAFPDPIDYQCIWLEDRDSNGAAINYTDCMESSSLRFVQTMLSDLRSLNEMKVPTLVDMELVHQRVQDPLVRSFFERYPSILHESCYDLGSGFDARQAWSRIMTRKPFFRYKRSAEGVYMNNALMGHVDLPLETEWARELEPCVHNIIQICRHFLGVDFDKIEARMPLSMTCETHALDVSAAAQPYLDEAMNQLSRPGMVLQCRMSVDTTQGFMFFHANIDVGVNGKPTWRWVLTRREIDIGTTAIAGQLAADCALGEDGNPFYVTSAHSHIERYDQVRHGDWQWLSPAKL
jgi:hypothetical protein